MPVSTSEAESKTISVKTFHIQMGYLEGKVLTIADAAFSDIKQRDAAKDLIKRMFREQRNHVDSIVWGPGINGTQDSSEPITTLR